MTHISPLKDLTKHWFKMAILETKQKKHLSSWSKMQNCRIEKQHVLAKIVARKSLVLLNLGIKTISS